MAIACEPDLLIADEPTTALDVTIQAEILELLRRLRAAHGMGLVLITHDLGVVAEQADRVAIMYAGRIVEEAPVRELFARPLHPYTRALLRSMPTLGAHRERLEAIPGTVPDITRRPSGCSFRDRCAHATAECEPVPPPLERKGEQHLVACVHA